MASTSVQSNSDSDSTTTTTTRMIHNNNNNSSSSNGSKSSSSSHKRKKSTRTGQSSFSESKRNVSTTNNGTGNERESEPHGRWRTEKQQQIYSSKLMEALSKVNLSPSSPSSPRRGRAVREAAYRVLAVAARGRSRWSRAILTRRWMKVKLRKKEEEERRIRGERRRRRRNRVRVLRLNGKRRLGSLQRKVRVLGRLVPGCRKETLPVILEEVTDYIAAVQMQIRAMSAIAHLLSSSSSSSTSTST